METPAPVAANHPAAQLARPLVLAAPQMDMHASRSGYPLLAHYLPADQVITRNIAEYKSKPARVLGRVVQHAAISRDYKYYGGFALERDACNAVRAGGTLHYLWGEYFLGFSDVFLRRSPANLVTTFHQPQHVLRQFIRKPARLNRIDRIICMSSSQEAFFRDAGLAAGKILTVHHGVDVEHFRPVDRIPSSDPVQVVSAGNYLRDFERLHQVHLKLADDPRFQFTVICPQRKRHFVEGPANVTVLSDLTDEQYLQQLQLADVLLMTLHDATANNVLVESLACGLPVVSDDVGGTREYLGPALSQHLHARDDAGLDGLVDSLIKMFDADDRRAQSIAARRRAEELAWPNVAAQMMRIYTDLAAR